MVVAGEGGSDECGVEVNLLPTASGMEEGGSLVGNEPVRICFNPGEGRSYFRSEFFLRVACGNDSGWRPGSHGSASAELADSFKVLSTTRGPIGWIAEGRDKVYRYHEPYSNELNPAYSHTDLEALEDVVRHLRS